MTHTVGSRPEEREGGSSFSSDPDGAAHIDEHDIRYVKIGQRVLIELDACRWEKLPGEVTAVGTVTLSAINEHACRAKSVAPGVSR